MRARAVMSGVFVRNMHILKWGILKIGFFQESSAVQIQEIPRKLNGGNSKVEAILENSWYRTFVCRTNVSIRDSCICTLFIFKERFSVGFPAIKKDTFNKSLLYFKLLYLAFFSLFSSLFWELRDKRNLENLQFYNARILTYRTRSIAETKDK